MFPCRETRALLAVVFVATVLALASAKPYAGSWNDGSRLATVESLVDHRTLAIDDSVFVSVPPPDDLHARNPYRGAALAMQDLLAGQIDMTFIGVDTVVPQLRAGSIKAYAVLAKSRFATAPDIPTVDEAGLPGFYFSLWYALFAPKRTPQIIVAKLNAAVVEALADPAVERRLADLGQEIFPREQQTPEALGAFQKAEIEKWWPIIKAAGIKAE